MYLKELTLRGFKSFASATTLRFGPGITAVVGPNGSGKSNIVDALAWVMGEQGAKPLRGSSMEDVIFAGTSSRPPLGRAQVTLTIDNTDHTLDIDYTEVTISRMLFRNGGSEYAINGSPCRLLDVQELLSDTGLGQQMHVIVGQGRLDAILHADPAGHRAFIEEAAGILKHRRRKERALRKLENTRRNLTRLDDLLGEIHRQLAPLARQTRLYRRAEGIRATLHDAQSQLAADDAERLAQRRERNRVKLSAVHGELTDQQRELTETRTQVGRLEAAGAQFDPAAGGVDRQWRDLSRLHDRLSTLAELADERGATFRKQIADGGHDGHGADDSGVLNAHADELQRQHGRQAAAVAAARVALDQATRERASSEERLATARRTLTGLRAAAKAHDSTITGLRGTLSREQAATQLAEGRAGDASAKLDELSRRLAEAQQQLATMREQTAQPGADPVGHDLAACEQTLNDAQRHLARLLDRQRDCESQIAALQAKAEAITDALATRDASKNGRTRILGRLADLIRVRDGWEEAVARALGPFSQALVVRDADDLLHALKTVHDRRIGGAVLLHPLPEPQASPTDGKSTLSAARLVTLTPHSDNAGGDADDKAADNAPGVLRAVRLLLGDVAATQTRADAWRAVTSGGWRRAVTMAGELVTGAGGAGGDVAAASDLTLVAQRDKARARHETLVTEGRGIADDVSTARRQCDRAREDLDRVRTRRTEVRLKAEQSARALEDAGRRVSTLRDQVHATSRRHQETVADQQRHRQKVGEVTHALAAAQHEVGGQDAVSKAAAREQALEASATAARDRETQTRIAWNDAARRAASLARQTDLLRSQARQATDRRAKMDVVSAARQACAARAARIAADARGVATLVDGTLATVIARRASLREQAAVRRSHLRELRGRRDALEPQVSELQKREHDLDLDRERLATRYEQLAQRIRDELDTTPERLTAAYRDSAPCDRAALGKQRDEARRQLAALGKVNPLASEEYDALQTRSRFLHGQRDDVAHSCDDLMTLVGNLDSTMADVFARAFRDTAAAFAKVFALLFPGGTGRLRLERPDEPLTSGVLVEARPAGKRVRRLSLLSGGERSLTALALLFAIFTARPSPFYVLDEVEAALDDVNLTRLLHAITALGGHAQLIIITHQQRTMGIADALYGVTMRDDGVSAVISQKLTAAQDGRNDQTDPAHGGGPHSPVAVGRG